MILPRRRFLQVTAGALAALGSPKIHAKSAAPSIKTSPAKGRAKNVIFLVADGMNTGTLSLAEQVNRYGNGKHTNWFKLYQNPDLKPIRALQETRSENALVTDSAAAGSSWGCGRRIPNRKINMTGADEALKPIGVKAKEGGKAVGLVSTCTITHATPASFAANVPSRDMEATIAQQYLERGIDVILGGGLKHFDSKGRSDHADLLSQYEKAGYTVVKDRQSLTSLSASSNGLLGLFADGHLPYSVDHVNTPELAKNVPTLSELTLAALLHLNEHKEGFLLQVEGGRVDHAGHANDAAGILQDQLAFDACIAVALDFQAKNPDTLIILTTDHGTGGCNINGEGPDYTHSQEAILSIRNHKTSYERFGSMLYEVTSQSDLAELIAKYYSLTPNAEEMADLYSRMEALRSKGYYDRTAAHLLNPYLSSRIAVNWTTQNHTGEHVELCAWGPGADQVTPFMENWQMHNVICQALAI